MRQVLRAGALGRPRGMGQGGKWEGGSGRGTHVNPRMIHVNVWQKPLQYCKVIRLQLIKINGKKFLLKLFPITQEKVQSSLAFYKQASTYLRAQVLELDCLESNPGFAT